MQLFFAKRRQKERGEMANENGQENLKVKKTSKCQRMGRNGERATK